MEIKKENIEKIILGILTFILIIYISCTLVFLSIFNTSEKFLNKNNVLDFINKIDIITIIKDEFGNEVNEFFIIEEELKDIGITPEGINEFIDSDNVKKFSTNLVKGVFETILYNNNNYYVQNNEVENLIEDNIDKLQTNSSLTQDQILNKLYAKIPNLVININKLIDKLCEKLETSEIFVKYEKYLIMSIDILSIIYSVAAYVLIIFVLISLFALLIFIRRDIYKSLKWLSISFITPGLLICILSYLLINKFIIGNTLIKNIIRIIVSSLNSYSFIYILIGVILITINIVMYYIKKGKNKI